MESFSELLKGGDRRSIGNSDAVVRCVLQRPDRFGELWACLRNGDPLVRMRAADALEKISRADISFFEGKKKELLSGELEDGTSELRWHLIAMTARLPLDASEARRWIEFLDHCLRHDKSSIVRVMALQAAWDIGARHAALAGKAKSMLDWAVSFSVPSVRARARKLSS